ncbi:DUF6438 domain-containing protein [Salipaludibacillus daqingensis]|uniref:DUF6438 domain-containing protein n=1 Tax=Salipaludibacillus daqingensis TaxID=3041001 RepID=UPI002474FC84|nr:DUF6438 domain-containing protein [Salipaludibacillus daqingensis]
MFRKIVINRTACNDESSIYQVAAFSEGKVFWHGEECVSKLGKHQWKLSEDNVQKLANVINDVDFHHLEYLSTAITIDDRPSFNLLVEFTDGSVKRMNHDVGNEFEDERLMKLEENLDRLIGIDKLKSNTHESSDDNPIIQQISTIKSQG